MKRQLLLVILSMSAFIMLHTGIGMFQLPAFASNEGSVKYYEVDNVYSSFNTYASGPAYAGKTSAIAARSTGGTSSAAGLSLFLPYETSIETEGKALVIDVNIYLVAETPYNISLLLSGGIEIASTGGAYTAYGDKIVSALTAESAGGYKLYASTGYNIDGTAREPFNRLVIPFDSFSNIGNEIIIQKINFTAQPTVSSVPKFTVGYIGVTDDYSSESVGMITNIFIPSSENFSVIGKINGSYLTAGQFLIYAGNSSSANINNVTSQVLLKMPDALIGTDGLVDVSKLKGIVFDISDLTTTNDLTVMLFDSNNATTHTATTGYGDSLKTVIASDGTIKKPTSKYFSKDHNSSLHMLNFKAATPASAEASFQGTMPEKISPYFALNVPKGKAYYGTSFTINSIKILLDDTVFSLTTEGNITADKMKGFAGSEVALKTSEPLDKIAAVSVNGNNLTYAEISELCSERGLKILINGDTSVRLTSAKEYKITAEEATGGKLILSQTRADAGERVRIVVNAEGGYKLKELTIDGEDVTKNIDEGIYVIENIRKDITITPEFEYTGEYNYNMGDLGSLYNSYPGMVWADKNAVNLAVTQEWTDVSAETDAEKIVGITATNINQAGGENKFLVFSMQVLTNNQRAYQFAVNGQRATAVYEYRICDQDFNVISAEGTKVTVPSVKVANSSLNQITATGFNGYIIIPLGAFGDIQSINTVSIFSNLQKNYARFNLYSIALTDDSGFSDDGSPVIISDEIIWTAEENNFEFYGTDPSDVKLRYLEKGEVIIEKIAHSNGRDALWWKAPEDIVGDDGYVSFVDKGIKGIVIDMENYNYSGIVFAFRLASSESATLTQFSTDNIWQTSQSNHPGKWIYENGLVRDRSTANFPYDDITGYFNGKWYIPLDLTGLTSLYTGTEYSTTVLPEKWQPIFRLVVGTIVEEEYHFKINSIKFVTDDTEFASGLVTSSAINGEVAGKVDGRDYGGTVNNNFILGSNITLEIKPDAGYVIESAKYTQAGAEPVTIDISKEGGSFNLDVMGDIVIQVICEAEVFDVTYVLNGGTLAEDAEISYTVEDEAILLKAATKKGYTFNGWYDTVGNRVTEIPEGSTGDIVLTAKWSKKGCGSSMSGRAPLIAGTVLLCAAILIKKTQR